ncbi:hypothetical protein HY029_03825 [Candidatus Gottesmanbacteria bacterium]|nr:hypothetical protein [Candidatus Gottesmanbacteria bacterium]
MKKLQLASIFIFLLTVISLVITAKSHALGYEVKKEIKQEVKEDRMGNEGTKPGILQRGGTKSQRAAIIGGTLSAKNGTTLTVTKDGKTYTVLTDSKTHFRREFWGKGASDEMQIGDMVNVHGKWADDAKTTIQAVLVRDMSIQKRLGVFFGTITNLNSTGWVMNTINRGSQTVSLSSSTKFTNRKGETIVQRDVVVGQRVRVRGLWDKQANTITEVARVKDFSLPVIPTPSK